MAHSEDRKATALAVLDLNGGNVKQTATQLNLSQRTLRDWKAGDYISDEVALKRDTKKIELADLFEQVARDILGSVTAEDIKNAPFQARMTGAAIATDKMQLLREKPTNITAQYADTESRRERITELLDAARARRDSEAA